MGFIANTIGKSSYWDNTTIIVTWDDWGGWYDNYLGPNGLTTFRNSPPSGYGNPDPFEYGLRTPLLVISKYAIVGVHTRARSQAAILRFIEQAFVGSGPGGTLGALGTGTADADTPFNDDLVTTGSDPLLNFSGSGLSSYPTNISSGQFDKTDPNGVDCPPVGTADIPEGDAY